jgi:hypothetical protein
MKRPHLGGAIDLVAGYTTEYLNYGADSSDGLRMSGFGRYVELYITAIMCSTDLCVVGDAAIRETGVFCGLQVRSTEDGLDIIRVVVWSGRPTPGY